MLVSTRQYRGMGRPMTTESNNDMNSPALTTAVGNESWIIPPTVPHFRSDYDRRGFSFEHRLAAHPLLQMPRLLEAAEEIARQGKKDHLFAFDSRPADTKTKFYALDKKDDITGTLRRIEEAGAWLKLIQMNEVLPEYRALCNELIAELDGLTGLSLSRDISYSIFTVLIASPGIVTPYHIDHESNFLFQLQGDKDIYLFPHDDRQILSEQEIEGFYRGIDDAAEYRDQFPDAGRQFPLTPGVAIHNPPLGPHWVQNGNNVSISLSLAFSRPDLEFTARVRQANLCLRQLGLSPRPPGSATRIDRWKSAMIQAMSVHGTKNREQILFSGIGRVLAPFRTLKSLTRRIKSAHNVSAAN